MPKSLALKSPFLFRNKRLNVSCSGYRGGGGGVLDQYLSIGEQLRVWNPDPVSGKRFLKYIPCLGQHPPFYYGLFRTKDAKENSRYNHCFCIPGVQRKFILQIKSIVQAIHVSCSRLSDSEEDAKVKGTRKVGGAGKMLALSQLSGPDYLGAWNRQ